jgi:predicted Zn-dependent protease
MFRTNFAVPGQLIQSQQQKYFSRRSGTKIFFSIRSKSIPPRYNYIFSMQLFKANHFSYAEKVSQANLDVKILFSVNLDIFKKFDSSFFNNVFSFFAR